MFINNTHHLENASSLKISKRDQKLIDNLFQAVKADQIPETKKLLNKLNPSIDRDTLSKSGSPLLHLAARNGKPEMVKFLCQEANMDPNILDYWGRLPIFYAAKNGYDDVVEFLVVEALAHPPLNKDQAIEEIHKAIACAYHEAIGNGHINTAELLSQHPNYIPEPDNKTALDYAKQSTYGEGMKNHVNKLWEHLFFGSIQDNTLNPMRKHYNESMHSMRLSHAKPPSLRPYRLPSEVYSQLFLQRPVLNSFYRTFAITQQGLHKAY